MLKKPPELDTNPIYKRLTRDSGWPDDRAARWLMVGVAMAGLLIALATLLPGRLRLAVPVMWLGWAAILITPAISAVVAVSIVTHDLQKEDFQMVRLTLATDKSLLHGYTYAALHRLHVLIMSTSSLIPALMVLGFTPVYINYPDDMILIVIIGLVGAGASIITEQTMCEIGAALGVTLAISWQRPIPAAIGASLIMLIMIVSPALCAVIVISSLGFMIF